MTLLVCLIAAAPEILWSGVTSGGVYSSVAPGDLDGDGITEVVCALNFWDDEPTVWCLSGETGDTLWTSSEYNGIYQDEGLMAVPDMDGDGLGDILMATPGGYDPPGRCLILISGADGALIWQWSAYQSVPGGTGWGYSCDIVPPASSDDTADFLAGFGTTGSSGSGLAALIEGDSGDTLWTRSAEDAVEDILSVPDVTGDNVREVILGVGGNSYTEFTLQLLEGSSGDLLWQRDAGGDVMCVTAVDRSETVPWIASCTFNGIVECHNLGGDSLWSLDQGGMLLDIESGPDLNGDGISELALAGDNAGSVCLDGANGAVLWSYPTGSNTWSVAWADSVWTADGAVPCLAGGSVNGKRVTLVDAMNGGLLWDQSFAERVYNVSVVEMPPVSPSPILVAGLQDQQSEPHHAWAMLTSTETSCGGGTAGGLSGGLCMGNPVRESLTIRPPEGDWTVTVYDLAGRLVWCERISEEMTVDVSGWVPGCYLVRSTDGELDTSEMVTILR